MLKKLLSITALSVGMSLAYCAGLSGAINNLHVPVLTSAKSDDTQTEVKGSLRGTANASYLIQFFNNEKDRPEGKTLLGQITVRTDKRGTAMFNAHLPATAKGTFVNATGKHQNVSYPTHTSVFSTSVKVK